MLKNIIGEKMDINTNEMSKWQQVLYIVNLIALFGLIIAFIMLPYIIKARGI
jgi:hypothetical protein